MIWGEVAVEEPVQGEVGVAEKEEAEHKVDWWEEEGEVEARKIEVYSNLKIHLLQQQRHYYGQGQE